VTLGFSVCHRSCVPYLGTLAPPKPLDFFLSNFTGAFALEFFSHVSLFFWYEHVFAQLDQAGGTRTNLPSLRMFPPSLVVVLVTPSQPPSPSGSGNMTPCQSALFLLTPFPCAPRERIRIFLFFFSWFHSPFPGKHVLLVVAVAFPPPLMRRVLTLPLFFGSCLLFGCRAFFSEASCFATFKRYCSLVKEGPRNASHRLAL